ncbi:hypothetical protein [Streptomyces sp. LMG1-1-1.1]|uniref:hypothetical protein n=1 Tax=Streptomyces sp. LMG1-1-1.1 TaxID=3135245 RepID=UPI003466C27D
MIGLPVQASDPERRALAVLRRESIERTLRGPRLTASQVNGIGIGLVSDLAALGITSAADFRRVGWAKYPTAGAAKSATSTAPKAARPTSTATANIAAGP